MIHMTRRRNHIPATIATTTCAGVRHCRWPPCLMMAVGVVVAFSPSLQHAHYTAPTTARGYEDVSSTPLPFRLSAEAVPFLSDNINNNDATTNTTATLPPLPSDMKLNEIKAELDARNTSFTDCFDRESLQERLIEARENDDRQALPKREKEEEEETVEDDDANEEESIRVDDATIDATNNADYSTTDNTTESTTTTTTNDFDRRSTLARLRSLRVKELKIRLSELNVRWGTMIEKEELVRALCNALEERFQASENFSRSGRLVPGKVADVDDESTLLQELGWLESSDVEQRGVIPVRASSSMEQTSSYPPILLDVYATWCGPCKFVAPILEQVAEEVGPTVRVIKFDSDKYPRLSSLFKVSGLPTLIRLDGGEVSKEIQRVEGALSKDQLIEFVNGNFNR